MRLAILLTAIFASVNLLEIAAQSSSTQQGINYQAVLAENGSVLANTSVSLRFSLLSSTNTFYQEEQMVITDEQGQVATQIGQGIATFGEFETLDWGADPITLKVELDTGNGFGEISQQPFQYVPYSFFAEKVRTLPVITMDSLTDVVAPRPAVGEILKWDGKAWIPGNDNVASGTEAAVNTSARIEGDGSAEKPLDLAQQNAQTGQVLKWNGTAWVPANDSVASGTQISVSTTQELAGEGSEANPLTLAPQDAEAGDVLKWNGTTWKPSEDESGASLWNEPDSGKVSFTGKIGLNVANPFLDIQSNGFFSHEGFFEVANSGFPTMRIRHNKQDNVFPQAAQVQYTVLGEQGQGLMLYETSGFTFITIDANSNRFDTYIRTNGRMGLGISSPREKLDIDGAIKLGNTTSENNGTIRYTGSDFEGRTGNEWVSLTEQGSSSSGSFWSKATNGQDVAFPKGKVGIGLEQPEDLLHIHNADPQSSSRSITRYTNDFTGTEDTGLEVGIQTNNGITDGIMRNQAKDGRLLFGTNSKTRMLIDNQGRVGIGTISPARLLSLGAENANTLTGQFLITQAGIGDAVMNLGFSNAGHYALGVDNSDNDKFKIAFNDDGPSGLTNSTLLTLQQNGNLGLGTSSPSRKLTISSNNNNQITSNMLIEQRGNGDAFMNFSLEGGASYALGIDNSDGDRFKIGYNSDSPEGVGNNTVLEMDANGNMEVKGEIRRTETGSANLVPLAMGKFRASGDIVSAVSTDNFTVKVVGVNEFEITLDLDLPPVNFTSEIGLVLATVSGRLNMVTASVGGIGGDLKIFIRVFDFPENFFEATNCLFCPDSYNVTFMFYRP